MDFISFTQSIEEGKKVAMGFQHLPETNYFRSPLELLITMAVISALPK